MNKILYALTCALIVTVACGTSSIAPILDPNELQTAIVSTALAAQNQTQAANVPTGTLVQNSPPIPSVTPPPALTEIPSSSTDTPVVPGVASGDAAYLPNPLWQPGADNPNVTQDNIHSTICVSGYTSRIRPPVSYTEDLKIQQIRQYGYTDTNLADYEEDHLIPLEVGGSPTDPKNLWPEPRYTAHYNASTKDKLENRLHEMVCSGQLPLDTARQSIATDWVAAYRQYVGQSIIAVTAAPTEP